MAILALSSIAPCLSLRTCLLCCKPWESILNSTLNPPAGFHCTGMPIQAAADNLRRDIIGMFNTMYDEEEAAAAEAAEAAKAQVCRLASTDGCTCSRSWAVCRPGCQGRELKHRHGMYLLVDVA